MRDKAFWRNLTKWERGELMMLQTSHSSSSYGGGGYLPDDCSECGSCGQPILGTGWCSACYARYEELMRKAKAIEKRPNWAYQEWFKETAQTWNWFHK